jgi:hypothetical protein
VQTYLPLNDAERDALRVQLEAQGDAMMIKATELKTWADELFERKAIQTKHEVIGRLVQLKFGQVSPQVAALIDSTDTEDASNALFDRVFAAETESDLLGTTP